MKMTTSDQVEQNVVFHDHDDSWKTTVESMPDPTFHSCDFYDAKLGAFLERPVQIASYDWQVGQPLEEEIDPWNAWATNEFVAKKLDNFNLLRCKLVVKVLINGTQFHYSRALVSYEPWRVFSDFPNSFAEPRLRLVQQSQKPHIFLDPSLSQGGTLELPFMHINNYIHISHPEDITYMGVLNFDSFDNLKHANEGTDPITVSVFAYATDIELAVPTIVLSNGDLPTPSIFTSQSDEYGTGIISKPASAIANVAGLLTRVPVIGVFARATQIASNAVGSIAHLFGFSRPAVVTNPIFTKPLAMGNLANCDQHEAVSKLTVDSKQELCVDPRTVGLSDIDELDIVSFCKRESYLTSFDWTITDPAKTLLFNSKVCPTMFVTSAPSSAMLQTPMCHVSQLFQYWCGSIKFRFQIVATNFHKGRLKLTYDPNTAKTGNYDAINVAYTRIIDIAKDKDFEIVFNWAQPNAYKPVLEIDAGLDVAIYRADGTTLNDDLMDYMNGAFSIEVLNELSAPTSTGTISINVFVSACDDIQFCGPTDVSTNLITFFPPVIEEEKLFLTSQSDEVLTTSDDNIPEGADPIAPIGTPDAAENQKNLVFFGEKIASLRTLLRRYNYCGVFSPFVNSSNDTFIYRWQITMRPFPFYRGYVDDAIHLDSAQRPYNFVNTTLVNYLTPCFIGRRGGIRFKHVANTPDSSPVLHTVERRGGTSAYVNNVNVIADNSNPSQIARSFAQMYSHQGGAFTTDTHVQSGVEVELPFYSAGRFALAKHGLTNTGLNYDYTNSMNMINTIVASSHELEGRFSTEGVFFNQYVAAGEDFNLFMFCGVPPVYRYTNPTADNS